MHHIFKSFPIALRMIFKDPVNLILAILPTLMALALYFSAITYIFWNSTEILSLQQNLYQIYHVYDENKLELANFYNAELIFYYGFAWSLFFMLALMIVIIVVVKRFVRSRFAFAAVVLLNMSIIDGLMNGKLVFRILDCSFFIIISYLIVVVLSKLRFKII